MFVSGQWLLKLSLCYIHYILVSTSNMTIQHKNPLNFQARNRSRYIVNQTITVRPLRFELFDAFPVPSLFKYEYIFGFSTGHCGTTALAAKAIFGEGNRQGQIHFEHELPSTRISHKDYERMNATQEYRFVQNLLFREIHKVMGPNETVFYDSGHHTLYFMNGLLKFLTETQRLYPTLFQYHILRVRRNRAETALSLTFHGNIISVAGVDFPHDRVVD
jgi:hypothetical protein